MPEELLNRSILNTRFKVDENAEEFYNINSLKLNVG